MAIIFDDMAYLISIPAAERAAAWKGRKLSKQGCRFKVERTREEEAATRKLRREIEAAEKAKREARLAILRERY